MYPPPYISHPRPYEFSHRPFASDFPSRLSPPYIPYDFPAYPPYYSHWDRSYFTNPLPTRPYDSYWNRGYHGYEGYEVPRPYLPPPSLAYDHSYNFRRPIAGGFPDRVPLMRPPIMRPPLIKSQLRMRPPIFEDFRGGERFMGPNINIRGPLAREPMNLRGFEGNLARSYVMDQEPLARSYYLGGERRQEKKKVRDDNNFEISKEFSPNKAEKREKQQQKKPENQQKQQPPAGFQQQFVSQQPNIPMNIRKI